MQPDAPDLAIDRTAISAMYFLYVAATIVLLVPSNYLPRIDVPLASFSFIASLLLVMAGLIIAHVNRRGNPVAATHYNYGFFMPFLLGLYAVIGSLLLLFASAATGGLAVLLIPIGGFALSAWWLGRCICGLIYLKRGQPVPDPDAHLW